MIDLKLLRTEPGRVGDAIRRRGLEFDLDALIALDERHRKLLTEVEGLRAEQNRVNKEIAAAEGVGREGAIASMRELSKTLKSRESELNSVKSELEELWAGVPNLVHPDSPDGTTEGENRVVKEVGGTKDLGFEARDHLALGEGLGIIDVERAAKVSGSRFGYLLGRGTILWLSLVRFAVDKLVSEGFVPVIPPVLVREQAMFGTGFFPADEAQVYKIPEDDLYLSGTSEVPLAAMHADEVLSEGDLPIRYAGFSTNFRREAGTYGKDTRGIIRVHQFEKVEMFSFSTADRSEDEHTALVAIEEWICRQLEIPYRLVEMCAGELAAPNYRKFDIEAWLPGGRRWLEITSCSNDIDYQARRLNIRAKGKSGNEPVHTLNGTAIAMRGLIALLENHQRQDGGVVVPEPLRAYTGFDAIEPQWGT